MTVKLSSNLLIQERIKELRENTDFLSTLLESLVGYAIIAADFDGNIIAFNEGARQIYGYDPEEVIGKQTIEIFFHREFIESGKLQEIIGGLIEKGRFSCEGEKVRKNGESFPAQIIFTLTKDRSGRVVGFIEIVADLTGSKVFEKRLWDSMSNFHKVINDSPDGIIITNRQGIVRYVNPAAESLFCRKSEDFNGKQFDFPITSSDIREVDITRKAGDVVVAEMRVAETVWYDEISYLISLHDITERRQVEQERIKFTEALQESLQFNSSVLENSPHSILVRKTDTSITYVNPALEKLTGFASSELIGKKNVFPFWTEEQIKEHNGNLEKAISTGIYKQERQFLKKNKEPFWVEVTTTPVRSKGQIKYFLSNWTDITERKRAEEKRQAIIKTALDGFWICNLEGKFLEVNESYCKITGYTSEELLEMSIQDIEAVESPEETARRIKGIVAQGSDRFETQHKRKDGKIIDIEISVNYFNIGEGQMFVFVRDITERKRAQEIKERLRQQLQAQVNELEAFSYGIAHDLRSPLVSIEGFSRLLREDLKSQKMESVEEDIRLLESGVKRMQGFLNSTLEYSRSGQMIKRTRDVSFSKIVKEVITEYNGQISSIGATVSIAKTFPKISVDRSRITEVLTNLIQNSIKYRDKTVPLKIEIGHHLSKGEIVFFVRDNGLGIDASEAKKVFALFYRSTADGEGSGIGLAIVRKIIEAHGGRIWVQAGQPGKGTTMCFTLPEQSGTNKDGNNGKD